MINISSELQKLKTAGKEAVLSSLEEQKSELEAKIYLINFCSIFNELELISKNNNQLHISIIISLEFDNQIGNFLNIKIRNTQTKFIYNKFKLANPKNNSKKDSLIKKIDTLFNQLNDSFKITYISNLLEGKKNIEFDFSVQELTVIKNHFLSSQLSKILTYSIMDSELKHNQQSQPINKI